ncbi:MAG: RNA polymerase sigma factor [Ferruginibacter sp.]|nr:RNA polymerase sigma factor [Cytophagales bacterium]
MLSEEQLIEGCCSNQRSSQKQLYERFSGKMLVVGMRYSKSRFEAEDILQEAFVKVFENIQTFRRECPLEQWIKRIVVNTALKQNRSKLYLFPAVDVDTLDEGLPDAELTLSGLQLQELLRVIQQLPTRCQVIFNLYAIEGYTHREIADTLGIQEGTSKSQYARARSLLQTMLKQNPDAVYESIRSR